MPGLADRVAGREKYLEYLGWLAEDEPARKRQRFDAMSRGWIIGSESFVQAMVQEGRELAGQGPRLAAEVRAARAAGWHELTTILLQRLGRKPADLSAGGKSEPWKLAIAASLKTRTTVSNRWLTLNLNIPTPCPPRDACPWSTGRKPAVSL